MDCLDGGDCVGPANIMLNYTWDDNIYDIVETLLDKCGTRRIGISKGHISGGCAVYATTSIASTRHFFFPNRRRVPIPWINFMTLPNDCY